MSAENMSGRKKNSAKVVRSAGLVLWRQFCKYCSCTALHGYQYITEPGRPLIERIIWLLCHCCAITVASVMIYATWTRYSQSPTATAVETTNFPVWKVPFPAVTICDPNQVTVSNAVKVAQRMSEGNKALEAEILSAFPNLRDLLKHNFVPFSNVSVLHNAMRKYGLSLPEFMRDVSPSCSDIMVNCQWKGVEQPCNQLFSRSYSDNGMCCSFNYAPPCLGKNCTANRAQPTPVIPTYTTAVGNKFGLRITLKYNLHERLVPSISTDAMRV
ncbi:sodium channel protein Nach-like [Cloeon dipterum]|uniref:sodium channel protein Nach-like n=1 Tax=Cloeon dipterum TaxID=197152 RepID=UPI0032205BF5